MTFKAASYEADPAVPRADKTTSAGSAPEGARRLLLTVPEAADALGCSERTLYRLIEHHGLPVVRLNARQRIPVKALEEWLDGRVQP